MITVTVDGEVVAIRPDELAAGIITWTLAHRDHLAPAGQIVINWTEDERQIRLDFKVQAHHPKATIVKGRTS